jgi:hypothetical protein
LRAKHAEALALKCATALHRQLRGIGVVRLELEDPAQQEESLLVVTGLVKPARVLDRVLSVPKGRRGSLSDLRVAGGSASADRRPPSPPPNLRAASSR